MAFTQTDLDNINRAIAKGKLTVEVDGAKVQYHSMSDLLMAKSVIERELSAGSSGGCSSTLAEFRDD